MPDPIPRNRSAGRSRPRRLARRPRDWPGRPFRQRRENAEQPAPPPAPPRPPAHRQREQGAWLGRPFGQRRENVERPEPAPAPAPVAPRPPAAGRPPAHRQRGWPRGPLQQRQGNVQRPGPRPPRPRSTRSSSQVVVGVLLCAVAALVVGIVVPRLFPSDTSSGSVVAAPASGQAGIVAPGSGDPDQVDDEPAAPLAAPGADRIQTQPAPALVGNRTAVPPGGGSSAPAGQSDPGTEPSPPADLGQRVDRSAVDQTQRPAEQPDNTESDQSLPPKDPEPEPQPEPPKPTQPPPGQSGNGGGATRADYEQQVRQAIRDYKPGSSRSNSGGGNGGTSGGTGSSGGTDSGGDQQQSSAKSGSGSASKDTGSAE